MRSLLRSSSFWLMVFYHCDIVHGEEDTTATTPSLLLRKRFLSTTEEGVGTISMTSTKHREEVEQGHDWLATEQEGSDNLFRYLQDISFSMQPSSQPGPLPSSTPPTLSPTTSVPSSSLPTADATLSPPSSVPLSYQPTVAGCIDPKNCNNGFLGCPDIEVGCCVDPEDENVLVTCSTDTDCCGEDSYCNMEGDFKPNVCCSSGGGGCNYANSRFPDCEDNSSETVIYRLNRRDPPVSMKCSGISAIAANTRICSYTDLIERIPIEEICQSQCGYGCSF